MVPGYVVDSSTTSWPSWSTPASEVPELTSAPRSGSRLRVSGVGTAITTASAFERSAYRAVARSLSKTAVSRSDETSSM